MGPENVLVKGDHLESIAADVLYDGRDLTEFRAERINTNNTHGSGCIFASAIAASLAHNKTVRESVTAAKDFITAAIRTNLAIGKGYGPANPNSVKLCLREQAALFPPAICVLPKWNDRRKRRWKSCNLCETPGS